MIDNYFEQILYRDSTNLAVNVVEELKSKQEKNKNFLNILILLRYKLSSVFDQERVKENIDKLDISDVNKNDLRILLNLPLNKIQDIIDLGIRTGSILDGIMLGDSIFKNEMLKLVADKSFDDTDMIELFDKHQEKVFILAHISKESIIWENRKEIIWNEIKNDPTALNVLPANSSLWEDHQREILEYIKENELLLMNVPGQCSLWENHKDEVWNCIKKNVIVLNSLPPNSSLWEEHQDEILEMIKLEPTIIISIAKDAKDEVIVGKNYRIELYNQKREQILKIIKNNLELLVYIHPESNFFKRNSRELTQMIQENNLYSYFRNNQDLPENSKREDRLVEGAHYSFASQYINYKNTNEVHDMLFSRLGKFKLLSESDVLKIIEIAYMVNPLYDRNLASEISRIKNILERKYSQEEKVSTWEIRDILKAIVNRLDSVGALKKGYEIERESKTMGLEFFEEFSEDRIRKNIISLSSEKDIVYNSIFYANKLTKLNETLLHIYALNNRFEREPEKQKEIKIIKLLEKVRREHYKRNCGKKNIKFVKCIEQYIKTGVIDANIETIIKGLSEENQELLKLDNLKELNDKYNKDENGEMISFDTEKNIFSHLDLKKIDSLNNYIEERDRYEKSATRIVRYIKELRLDFKNRIDQEMFPEQNKYLYRKESDFTSFLFLNRNDDDIYGTIKDEFNRKLDKLIQNIANELADRNDVSQKNMIDAEVIVYYINQAMTYEQLLYSFKNRLIEQYIKIAPDSVKGFDLNKKPKCIYETSIENRKLYKNLKRILEDSGKSKTDYESLQGVDDSKIKIYKRCLINETIFELLKEGKKEENLSKEDFLEKGISEKDFQEWKNSILRRAFKQNIPKRENRFLFSRFIYGEFL